MTRVTLRLAQSSDHAAIATVNRTSFGGEHGVAVAAMVQSLRRGDPGALELVAEEEGRVVGHVMFSRGLLDAPERLVPVQTLSPLGIAPERQRTGLGSALVREGLRRLDEAGAPLVFLEGNPAYYSRFGFVAGGEQGFRRPSLRIPEAAFQVVKLSAYEPWMTGTHVYAQAFWDHDCVGLRA